MKLNTNSDSGFKYGIVAFLLILNLLIYITLFDYIEYSFELNLRTFTIIIILIVLAFILSVIGLIKSFLGIREPNTIKKIIGFIINFGILFFYLFITNDVYKAFYNLN